MAGISDDVENLRVNRNDFMNALGEVQPAFGVAEEELQQVIQNGIIHFAPHVDVCAFTLESKHQLTAFDRNCSKLGNSLLNKSGRLRERRSSAFSCMDLLVLEKPHWRPPLLRPPGIPSSSYYPQIRWSDSQSPRRLLPSIKSSRTVIRVR